MNGISEYELANLFVQVLGMSMFFGTFFGFVARGFTFVLPKGRGKKYS